MKAGNSKYDVGTRIRIRNMKGEDKWLNGMEGYLTHPFGCFGKGTDVGVYLDNKTLVNMGICNLMNNEFEEIIE